MNRYFHTFESVTPDFVARAWVGDTYAAEHEYRGRTTDRDNTLVPMDQLTGDSDIVVEQRGIGPPVLPARPALRAGRPPARRARRGIRRRPRLYEAVDDPGDVTRDADGTWHIRAGATVRVRLTMVADSRVARTSRSSIRCPPDWNRSTRRSPWRKRSRRPQETGTESSGDAMPWCWCWRQWFEHQNMRDDRVEAFTSYLAGGTYEYTYIARATTPGHFVVPPTKAEELYAPEVFGRSASATVVVA